MMVYRSMRWINDMDSINSCALCKKCLCHTVCETALLHNHLFQWEVYRLEEQASILIWKWLVQGVFRHLCQMGSVGVEMRLMHMCLAPQWFRYTKQNHIYVWLYKSLCVHTVSVRNLQSFMHLAPGHCSFFFSKHYSKSRHLLGTIFSGGRIHIWCSSEYFWQQDGVCGNQNKLQCVCSW